MGGGGGDKKNILEKAVEAAKPAGPAELPTDPTALSQNMMSRGRPAFDFSGAGAVQGLMGQVAQPNYTTPPPQFNKQFWMNWSKGKSVDGANYKGSGWTAPDVDK